MASLKRVYSPKEIEAIRMALTYLSNPNIGYRKVGKLYNVSKTYVFEMFHKVLPQAYDKLADVVGDKAYNRSPNFVLLREIGMTQNKLPEWKANRSQAAIIMRARKIIEEMPSTKVKAIRRRVVAKAAKK